MMKNECSGWALVCIDLMKIEERNRRFLAWSAELTHDYALPSGKEQIAMLLYGPL
jgi:hypothetical protein